MHIIMEIRIPQHGRVSWCAIERSEIAGRAGRRVTRRKSRIVVSLSNADISVQCELKSRPYRPSIAQRLTGATALVPFAGTGSKIVF
jgi:hypothetical protein